ncbi:MAG TPA: glycosyltransferase family 4 protein [Verrucomicrobiae bacterium]|nr:glycosyltransferase family 4 protein [Verrucomicrobiae bacterium]
MLRKAEALVSAGYRVDVLALRSSRGGPKAYCLNGVNVYAVSLGKKRGSLARYSFEYFAFFFWALFKLSVLMRNRRYAIVDVNNLPDFLVFAAVFAKWKGAKVVFDMHEITPEFYRSKYGVGPDTLQVRLATVVERASVRFADHVITINEPIRDLIEHRCRPASKPTVIMNSADESIFSSVAGVTSASGATTDPEKFVMMYHGTLTHIYGLDIALEAFGRAQQEMPGAEFWILGNGPEKGALESLARKLGLENKVKFPGTVPPQEIPEWLRRCDVGVLATRQDVFLDYSFSNKLSEYIIVGKPVVSSRLKTIRHYFTEEALAFFEPHNPADLAKQILRMYRDPALRIQHARKAKLEYAPIRWEVMKDRYLALMGGLLGTETVISAQPSPPLPGVMLR